MTGRKKEKLLSILAVITALVLLMSVFAFAEYSKNRQGSNSANGKLMEIKNRSITLVQSGKTLWQYKSHKDDQWNLGQGAFGSDRGKRTDSVTGRLPANLLDFYTADKLAIPVYYFRMEFNLDRLYDDWELSGSIQYDDAVVVYINGQQAYSENMPDQGFDANGYGAKRTVDRSRETQFAISDTSMLKKGKNEITVEVHQSNSNSEDVYFDFKKLKYEEGINVDSLSRIPGSILQLGETEKDIKVNWLTKSKGQYKLQYTKTNVQKVLKEYIDVPMRLTEEESKDAYCYTGRMTDLEPGAEYTYRIASMDEKELSAEYNYAAPINEKEFSFLFAGDPQVGANSVTNDGNSWEMALDIGISLDKKASFIISAGDQIDSKENEGALEEYFGFRKAKGLKSLPIVVTRGNHEAGGKLYDLQFEEESQTAENDYYYTYKDALFISIDSNNKDYEKHRGFISDVVSKTEHRWVIIVMHQSMFGTGPHAVEKNIETMREEYAQFFSDMDVDLVLSGHDHIYSRSYLMKGDKSTGRDDGVKNQGETMYLTENSVSGSKTYDNNVVKYPYLTAIQNKQRPCITSIEVSKNKMKINTYRLSDLKKIDYCIIQK